jgi:hypothetical protein
MEAAAVGSEWIRRIERIRTKEGGESGLLIFRRNLRDRDTVTQPVNYQRMRGLFEALRENLY